ncbi:type III-B CRISPR module-associated protein Cmr5 [Maridesulfovibrio sp.]|uniref:type III-B CRISPR module-associated protein Cmr5 n=1 Tax=Maridesulfovibrio sp. TaxID=2795000 RepID=UPI0029F5590D|nr:type III-B CRISPR module-associated protein Cmr5 [Maridesulfovibrio sp.]
MISKENILAERSFKFISNINETKSKDEAADIRTELEGLPAKIKINGLTQTLIYLLEKSKKNESGNEQNDRYLLGRELVDYLKGRKLVDYEKEKITHNHPEDAYSICKKNLRHATIEATAYLAWLKRMAKALIEKKKTDETSTEADHES